MNKSTVVVFRMFILGLLLQTAHLNHANAQTSWEIERLSDTSADNVAALAEVLAYVKYWYPSDAAAETDWDQFAIEHIESVEPIASPDELAAQLSTLFQPYAPLLSITTATEQHQILERTLEPDQRTVQWIHTPTNGSDLMLEDNQRMYFAPDQDEQQLSLQRGTTVSVEKFTLDDYYVADLPRGLSIQFPLALVVDADGNTLPLTDTVAPIAAPEGVFSTAQRRVRLADVAIVWGVFQHLYPYWAANDCFEQWDARLIQALQATAAAPDVASHLIVLREMLDCLNDGHVRVFDTTQPPPTDVAFLPFTVDVIEEQIVITTVMDEPRLSPGDRLVAINGVAVDDLLQSELSRITATGQYATYMAFTRLMAGAAGDTAVIEVVSRDTGTTETVTLGYRLPLDTPDIRLREYRPPPIAWLADGVLYLDITRASSADLVLTRELVRSASSIIIDVRGYPSQGVLPNAVLGPLTDEPLNTPPFFRPVFLLPDASAITLVDFTRPDFVVPTYEIEAENVVFLANGNGAISYSETLLGVVQGNQLGTIVGSRTAGANGNVTRYVTPSGLGFQWTGLVVNHHDGSTLMGQGIQPDVLVERTLAGVEEQSDEVLIAAFQLVAPNTDLSVRLPE